MTQCNHRNTNAQREINQEDVKDQEHAPEGRDYSNTLSMAQSQNNHQCIGKKKGENDEYWNITWTQRGTVPWLRRHEFEIMKSVQAHNYPHQRTYWREPRLEESRSAQSESEEQCRTTRVAAKRCQILMQSHLAEMTSKCCWQIVQQHNRVWCTKRTEGHEAARMWKWT